MHFFTLLLLLATITSCNNSAGVRMPRAQNMEVNSEFHPFIKEGVYQVNYYVSREVTTEHKQLLKKLSKLIETNTQTQKYFRQIEEGKKPAYNPSIGISRQEYNRLIDLFVYKAPEKLRGTLNILRDGNRFSFQGDDRLSLLDSLFLTITNKSASFKMYNMTRITDSIDLSNEDIPKGDTLKAYEFYKGPEGILGLTGLDGTYELLIGKLTPSGRTYLSFFAKLPDNIEYPIPEFITVIIDK